MSDVTKKDVDNLSHVLHLLVEWSGVTDESPDDTEILSVNGSTLVLGDIRDASVTLNELSTLVQTRKK